MAVTVLESRNNSSLKPQKLAFVSQVTLRVFASALLLAAAWLTFTSKQAVDVFGIQVDARYSYSPAFRFFAFANLIACCFTVLSLLLAFIVGGKAADHTYYYFMFLHDLIITLLLMAGCSAATAVGYIGKYGNSHAGWMAICDHFTKYCNKILVADLMSYLTVLIYLVLTIVSANKSRHIHV